MRKITFIAIFLLFLLCIGCSVSSESTQPVFLDTTIKWPKSGLAKKLPEPEFGQLAGVTDTPDEFCAAFADISQEDLRDYIERVKKAGFTVDAELSDQAYMGIEMFSYSAENKDGLVFMLSGTAGTCTITLTKP
ncbi:MAG TPA: hypothetical protein PK629_00165 [Oscillospiraceae bacterium]|nr:hypothetical protein [Oscillospiraceae bacterium]HPF56027.1 hypothetical protein [Clostridiales bacterium]HPK35517.1 hypothetical protein [Oscillospiraceae bacterium]HPR75652.1 hypothetical protein [Oscillospiraceae bacterium]